jgi:hypothetical protein
MTGRGRREIARIAKIGVIAKILRANPMSPSSVATNA